MTEEKQIKEWNQQDKESDKQYYFFQQFINIEEPITIDKFYKKILKECQDNTKNPYKIPTLNTLYSWTKKFTWINRKEDYRKHILSRVGEELEELYLSKLLDKFKLNDEIDLLILTEVKSILNDSNYKGNKAYAIEKLMKANNITVENQRLIAGEPTEIISSENKNWNANKDVDESDDLNIMFKKTKEKMLKKKM